MKKVRLSEIFPLVLIFNFIIDFIFYLDEDIKALALFRIIFNISYVGIVVLKNKKSSHKLFLPLFILLVYSSLLIFFSSDIYSSIIEFVKFSSTLLFLPVSFYLINSKEKFINFVNGVYPILILYVGFVIISNIYDVGSNRYSNEGKEIFRVALGDAKLYAPAFLVGMLPILIKNNIIKRKKLYTVIGFINLLLLILTIRRTAIFIIIFIPFFYYLITGNIKTVITSIFGVCLFLILTFPIIKDQFNSRLSERYYLTENDYSYKKEGRFLELLSVMNLFYKSNNGLYYLFGKDAYNTAGNYGFYDKERPIHSDYTYVFFCAGFVGLFLYISIFTNVFLKLKRLRKKINTKIFNGLYKIYFTLFVLILIIGVSGNIWAITYKSFTFSLLGSFLGLFFSLNKKPVSRIINLETKS